MKNRVVKKTHDDEFCLLVFFFFREICEWEATTVHTVLCKNLNFLIFLFSSIIKLDLHENSVRQIHF